MFVAGTQAVCTPGVIAVIAQATAHDGGAVNKPLTVTVQLGFAEKFAETPTEEPVAVKPVKVTVCGLAVMAKLCPFTINVPDAGGFAYVIVTSCEYVFVAGTQADCAPAEIAFIVQETALQAAGAVKTLFSV